ncbi:MAG TPA: hypothetical protein DE315_05500 [Candidatus Omnitrophica bacterium]|nr:hypothetical protein [Candidatus Omnitrophota bacterium]
MNDGVKRLDIGCGTNKVPGSTYLDVDENAHPDILHDLNKFPYPVKDNSFDEIYAKHIIEHLDRPQEFLAELCRILAPGGTMFIETPHFSSYVAYSEVQHKLFYSYFLILNLIRPLPLKILKYEITFYKTFRMFGIKYLANKCPRTYERFWTYMFPAENLKILLRKE